MKRNFWPIDLQADNSGKLRQRPGRYPQAQNSEFKTLEDMLQTDRQIDDLSCLEGRKSPLCPPRQPVHLTNQGQSANSLATANLPAKSKSSQGLRKPRNRLSLGSRQINTENRTLAQRICNLPPVINMKRYDKEFEKHQSDLNLMQKYHQVKLAEGKDQQLVKTINKLTGNKFQKSNLSNLQFLRKVDKSQQVCLLSIAQLDLYRVKHKAFLDKNPYFYLLRCVVNAKLTERTNALQMEAFQQQVHSFRMPETIFSLKFQLLRQKQNEESTFGEFEHVQDNQPTKVLQVRENIALRGSGEIASELKRTVEGEEIVVGRIRYSLLRFYRSSPHQNQSEQRAVSRDMFKAQPAFEAADY